ncbi:major facilitator superfamily transporter [Aspergillus luchuensis]|uniref:Major facilitator superfamily transporter n=1 Tax=Aspergillus kawachii TaxID=1069201 RepID=A0A146FYZ3_ASPKA|nr:major facilitator superfamily transporter [Aspergillus luchuensis]
MGEVGNVYDDSCLLYGYLPGLESHHIRPVPSNVAGKTKRSVVSAMTLIAYCAGNMAGAQVFKTKDAPRYVSGTIACSVCFALEVIVILAWRGWYMWENRRRERIVQSMGISKEEQERRGRELGAQDVTDMNNVYFRYTM